VSEARQPPDRNGFRLGSKVEPVYVSPEFRERLQMMTPPLNPRFGRYDGAIAACLTAFIFFVLICARCP
jgi:hypothetical protein